MTFLFMILNYWLKCISMIHQEFHHSPELPFPYKQLSMLVSLLLLSDVRSLLDSAMSEVVSKARIVKVVAEVSSLIMINHF